VLEHWNSLTLHFQATVSENNLPSAKAILNALNNPVYKLYLQFLKFNLERITQLNLEFQSEQSKMPVYLDKITTLYKNILKCFIKQNILDSSDKLHDINVQNPSNFRSMDQIY
jgi:hypothetical protein